MFSDQRKSSNKKSPRGAGFYIALAVCLAAIGASVWTTADSLNSLRAPVQTGSSSVAPVGNPVSGVPYSSTAPQSGHSSEVVPSSSAVVPSSSQPSSTAAETIRPIKPSSSQKPEPSSSQKPKPSSSQALVTNTTYIMPVSGRIIKPFSDSAYSLTFEDWRAHMGVDIAARQGSNVISVGNGNVTEIYRDDLLGTVVAIRHDALEVHYCGLGNNPSVKAGEDVMCGQVLGVLREIPGECVDESHLHLQVKKDGQWVEPLAALGKEEQLPSEPA